MRSLEGWPAGSLLCDRMAGVWERFVLTLRRRSARLSGCPAGPVFMWRFFLRAPLDEVWRLTQQPAVHQRWDLRFSEIRYLPRTDESEPQRFLYATRIGFGLAIRGTGESVGERIAASGEATSSLSFASQDWKSLISTGSGYWRYIPLEDGVRFFTWYDYATRFGVVGRVVDRCVFRPLMGWATAWSFDRLRLWLEQRQAPETSLALGMGVCTGAIHSGVRMDLAWAGAEVDRA